MDECPFCVQCQCGKSEARADRPGFAERSDVSHQPPPISPPSVFHWARVDALAAGYASLTHITDHLCQHFTQKSTPSLQGGTVWLQYVYIGRRYRAPITRRWQPASPWHDPFKIGQDGDRTTVLARYPAYLDTRPDLLARLPELSGKLLVCWCAPEGCHGEELLRRLGDGSYERYQAAALAYRIAEGRDNDEDPK